MKRISYIVFGVAFLALASCQKEVIMPNDPAARNASDVEFKSSEFILDKNNGKRSSSHDKVSADPNAANSGNNSGNASGDGSTDDSGITDPNNDPDAAKKKGKK